MIHMIAAGVPSCMQSASTQASQDCESLVAEHGRTLAWVIVPQFLGSDSAGSAITKMKIPRCVRDRCDSMNEWWGVHVLVLLIVLANLAEKKPFTRHDVLSVWWQFAFS
jgi:hypothetical protein